MLLNREEFQDRLKRAVTHTEVEVLWNEVSSVLTNCLREIAPRLEDPRAHDDREVFIQVRDGFLRALEKVKSSAFLSSVLCQNGLTHGLPLFDPLVDPEPETGPYTLKVSTGSRVFIAPLTPAMLLEACAEFTQKADALVFLVAMNARDYADIRKYGRDVIDIEDRVSLLREGLMGRLWDGMYLYSGKPSEIPTGTVYLMSYPREKGYPDHLRILRVER